MKTGVAKPAAAAKTDMDDAARPILELRAVSKTYGSTTAARDVSFTLFAGEVHALVGENGAGKSTLLNILSGVVRSDLGEILVDGQKRHLLSPRDAQGLGISTVFQELSLASELSVEGNIFAGRLPSRFGLVVTRELTAQTNALFDSLGINIDARSSIGDLPVSSRQIVEIAKAVSLNAHILLLDEPTSALNADEKAALFRLVARLKSGGVGIIYISHHLDEVLTLADRVTVLRDGAVVSTRSCAQTTLDSLVRDMVGRTLDAGLGVDSHKIGETILDVDAVSLDNRARDISMTVKAGEIVAIAGLLGSGSSLLASMLAGLRKPSSGTISVAGRPLYARGMRSVAALGVAYVPPERKSDGLFLDLSISNNMGVTTLRSRSRFGLVDETSLARTVSKWIEQLSIKVSDASRPCRSLSGGNQQKVLLAKWLETTPRLLVVEEPTKGVDISAKRDIHRALRQLASTGVGILLISSDLPEILSLSHRVLIMRQGRMVADLATDETTEQAIVARASGLSGMAA
jgi:ribose transport system ATP-binding protein